MRQTVLLREFKKRCLDLVNKYIRCTLFKIWRIQNNFVAIANCDACVAVEEKLLWLVERTPLAFR